MNYLGLWLLLLLIGATFNFTSVQVSINHYHYFHVFPKILHSSHLHILTFYWWIILLTGVTIFYGAKFVCKWFVQMWTFSHFLCLSSSLPLPICHTEYSMLGTKGDRKKLKTWSCLQELAIYWGKKICAHNKRLNTRAVYDMSQVNNTSSHTKEKFKNIFWAGMIRRVEWVWGIVWYNGESITTFNWKTRFSPPQPTN